MKHDAGDFDDGRGAMPLFEQAERAGAERADVGVGPYEIGLFERSKIPPTDVERVAAKMIFSARGRDNPVALAVIAAALKISDRQVKETVEKLRLDHGLPIGARRTEPAGYFWIVDEEDAKVAAEPYRKQLVTMARVFRAVSNPVMRRELEGQIRLELRD